jgi:mRNA interferase MazF
MVNLNYVPRHGDVVWLNFSPQVGHEQSGKRPAIVLSSEIYNKKTGLAIFCPITNQIKGYPFEVNLPDKFPVSGTILADQIKNFDWKKRGVEFIGKLSDQKIMEIIDKLLLLLEAK